MTDESHSRTSRIVNAEQPVRKSAQRLRWFVGAFEEQVKRTSEETGVRFLIDYSRLSEVFVAWLKDFNAQKPDDPYDRPAYVGFAAGLMLRTLVTIQPLSVESIPDAADETNPAYFWPEGYLYVAFCLNVRGLVLEKDFRAKQLLSADLDDLRTWWSFKENVEEDPSLAIAFLDLFAGDEPKWTTPGIFSVQGLTEIARRFYAEVEKKKDERG